MSLFREVQAQYQKHLAKSSKGWDLIVTAIKDNAANGQLTIVPNTSNVWPIDDETLRELKKEGFSIRCEDRFGTPKLTETIHGVAKVIIGWS